jgi:mRNA interferase RelE/StbE
VTYQVKTGRCVRKVMARIPGKDQTRILATLRRLAEEPRPAGCVPVKTAEPGTYRIRVGAYRVIYTVLDDERVIVVARVSRRKESTYRGLR